MIRLNAVLLATDFSDAAAGAAEYAYTLAERFGAELHLLSVVEEVAPLVVPEYGGTGWVEDYVEKAERAAGEKLEALPGGEWRERLPAVVRATRRGHAFLEIVHYAAEHGIDLIVTGTHGRSGLMHVLLGSVAERVVRKAPCPVLTVRPAGPEAAARK